MVTFTILSNTEGGPSFNDEDTAVDGAAAAAAMLRRAAGTTDRRATLLRLEESMMVVGVCVYDGCVCECTVGSERFVVS